MLYLEITGLNPGYSDNEISVLIRLIAEAIEAVPGAHVSSGGLNVLLIPTEPTGQITAKMDGVLESLSIREKMAQAIWNGIYDWLAGIVPSRTVGAMMHVTVSAYGDPVAHYQQRVRY